MAKHSILGPRIPINEYRSDWARYSRPTLFFALAMMLLVGSLFVPYWDLKLEAPQFPKGLHVRAFVNRLEGRVDPVTNSNDLDQLDELNHYVGMPSLADGAAFERSIAVISIITFAGLLFAAIMVHNRWALLAALPALLFPVAFLADLQYWLWNYGHSLDPRAPLASAGGEFTPHLFGPSKIAQFDTMALPGGGLIMATIASAMVALGLWYHRKAYRPLIETAEAGAPGEADSSDTPDSTAVPE